MSFIGGPATIWAATESQNPAFESAKISPPVVPLMNWIKNHRSPRTGLPLSFYVPEAYRSRVLATIGDADSVPAIIERTIVEEGFVVYDGALWQIVLTAMGDDKDLELAFKPITYYWAGSLKDLVQIRSGYPASNFMYDPEHPGIVSSHLDKKGIRGFIFRILNAHGRYLMNDPLDGKNALDDFPNLRRIHWEDWKPIAGENAWVVLSALHMYHKKYFDRERRQYQHHGTALELLLSKELSRAALVLQCDNGGIRMAPIGTYRNPTFDPETNTWQQYEISPEDYQWHYYEISTENNLSWYAALTLLNQITPHARYQKAINKLERYFQAVWDDRQNIFYQGMHYADDEWRPNTEHFAVDVQAMAIAVLSPAWIDQNFGAGKAYQIWQATKTRSGFFDKEQRLLGAGYTDEHDRMSIEWTCISILALRQLAAYYQETHPDWVDILKQEITTMRQGVEQYRYPVSDEEAAYAYSSKRGWIPWGWFSHDPQVLSLVSTCWVMLIDQHINPFILLDGGI